MKRNGRQFVYRVDDGKDAVKIETVYRPYHLPRTPRHYKWAIGEQAVYVQCTAAGWMASSIIGTIIGFVQDGRQRKAQMKWHVDTDIAPTISLQRLRPFSLIYDSRF